MSNSTTTTTTAVLADAPHTTLSNALGPAPATEPKRCHYIPWPETLEARRRWQLEQMAGAFRIFAKLGYADGGSGHISLRGMTPRLVTLVWRVERRQGRRLLLTPL